MSFLAGRVAGSEAKYFREESGSKANEIRKKKEQQQQQPSSPDTAVSSLEPAVGISDVLPEVLKNSVPLSFREASPGSIPAGEVPSGFSAVEGAARSSGSGTGGSPSHAGLSSARAVGAVGSITVPDTRLGPAKYQLQFPEASSGSKASTANERRVGSLSGTAGGAPAMSRAQQAAAAAEGFVMVSKAFGIATLLVYGGAALTVALAMRALNITRVDEIPEKGRAFLEPRAAAISRSFEPLKCKVNEIAQKWRMNEEQQRSVGEKYAKVFGAPQKRSGV